jgi:ribosomal protein S27AE
MLSRKIARLVIAAYWCAAIMYLLAVAFCSGVMCFVAVGILVLGTIVRFTKLRCPVCGRHSILLSWSNEKRYYCYRCGSEAIYDDTIT